MIEPNAHPIWVLWGEWFWLALVVVGAAVEVYAAFVNPHVPTFTGMVKRFCPWPFLRACLFGGLFYHFCIQPLYETFKYMGIKIF